MDDSLPSRRLLERIPSSQAASSEKRQRLAQLATPPTPDSIAADRQALHELCSAVEANNLSRAEALRGVLETLRATHDSRPANKQEPREPRSWPEWPSNRYNLSNMMERDTKEALREALKNAQISGLDEAWSLRWFYKVLSHFKAEQSTLDYKKSNHQRLVAWTPELQITQICSHETQATVDTTFQKLANGHLKLSNAPVMEQMTFLMENHRRAHERCQTEADIKQNLLNHCIVQLLEDTLGSRTYERTLQLHPKWQLMETHELLQLLSPDIQEAQIRSTQRLVNHRDHNGDTDRGETTNSRPSPHIVQRQ
ncbi:hypothetical protein SARC_03508 [Sphaeroforma arctica JP610]|uniref:Uncharacterized protein n=1 Tax=Sphaeroforma arctica JP610 TaxID=667725 RepID=A0A0L0G5F6_9EUKA|nr:hypothetical protein SARC_03508 [Sphaeroforma arctica JP610]KNC84260.1 hypothetical protein SARC_03508 [Sphaeroforma arctica JP610]|eukprot:XP_014158162.1 hypothetical protein SARC_03508 [Sphaeroforma arctica JP610]